MSRDLKPGETIQTHTEFVTVSVAPKARAVLNPKGGSIGEYYESSQCDLDAARYELNRIKGEIENLIFWKRSGQNKEWWGAEQDATAATHNAKWSKALADWKSNYAVKSVDTEKMLREVFNSVVGRTWNEDASVKQLSKEWAGL